MELAKVSLKLRQILYQCLYDLKILQCIHINRVCLVHYIGVAVGIVNRKLGVQRLCTVKVNGAVGAVQCLQSLSAGVESPFVQKVYNTVVFRQDVADGKGGVILTQRNNGVSLLVVHYLKSFGNVFAHTQRGGGLQQSDGIKIPAHLAVTKQNFLYHIPRSRFVSGILLAAKEGYLGSVFAGDLGIFFGIGGYHDRIKCSAVQRSFDRIGEQRDTVKMAYFYQGVPWSHFWRG